MAKKNQTPNLDSPPLADQVLQLEDRLKRSLADYINLEKRLERDREIIVTYAVSSVVSQMVEVLDTFYLAQKHLQDPGLKMAIEKFETVLKNQGLTTIETKDHIFDPNTMECVGVALGKPNQVISVEQNGYSLNNVCLRPAKVIVGKSEN